MEYKKVDLIHIERGMLITKSWENKVHRGMENVGQWVLASVRQQQESGCALASRVIIDGS